MRLLLPGAPERKKLDAIQVKIKALIDERRTIEKAPLALADMKADALAKVHRFNERHPVVDLDVSASPNELPSAPAERALAFIVAAIGDDAAADVIVKKRVVALKAAGKVHGLPRAERATALAKIDAELIALYRAEEQEAWRLEETVAPVMRRAEIDGALVVAVWREFHVHDVPVAA